PASVPPATVRRTIRSAWSPSRRPSATAPTTSSSAGPSATLPTRTRRRCTSRGRSRGCSSQDEEHQGYQGHQGRGEPLGCGVLNILAVLYVLWAMLIIV